MNVMIVGDEVIIDGVKLPPIPHGGRGSNVTTVNDRVFVNGYEWKNGRWQRTLMALWHLWF